MLVLLAGRRRVGLADVGAHGGAECGSGGQPQRKCASNAGKI